MLKKIKTALRYLLGKNIGKYSYSFSSHLKLGDLPKGEWIFVSTNISIDEVNDYWIEDVRICCEKDNKRKLYIGELSELEIKKNNKKKVCKYSF